MKPGPKPKPLDERLLNKALMAEGGCWVFRGALNRYGYGVIQLGQNRGTKLAHILAYELWVGSIPDDMELDHLCRNPRCFRPDHLEAVTHVENIRRGLNGILKTHCPRGHSWIGENIYVRPGNGTRMCRLCYQERNRERRERG